MGPDSPAANGSPSAAAGPEPVSPDRQKKVDAARQRWIRQLVDLSRRNNLLYFRDLRVGTIEVTGAQPKTMQALLRSGRAGSEAVLLSDLVPQDLRAHATHALTQIEARARSNFEERGLDTLFLALGLASWKAADGGRDTAAPVLLVPLIASQQSGRSAPWVLRRAGDVKVNEVLVHALREEHGVALDPETLLPDVQGDDEGELFDLNPVFAAVERAAGKVPAFSIERRWVLGNFAFQKMAIVKDLQQLGDALGRHQIVAGIAGDRAAADEARGDRTSVDALDLDRQPPEQEFLIRDADSSQQRAIVATLKGQNGVISGPPGTGKSQTIANLIAEAVARGKTVLFVAEKRAALDVVLNRLKDAQLDHLCLDCHGAELTRRRVAEQLQTSIARVREASPVDVSALHAKFVERRDRLNAHVRSVHQTRKPGGLSLYELYGRILRLPIEAAGTTRIPRKSLDVLDQRAVEASAELLREATSLGGLVTGDSASPWAGATFTTSAAVRTALEGTRRLGQDLWPRFEKALGALLAECPVRVPTTVAEARNVLDALVDLGRTLAANDASLFLADLDHLCTALAPARSRLGSVFAPLFNAECRRGLSHVRGYHRGEKLPAKAALALAERARDQLTGWREMATDRATTPTSLSKLSAASVAWTPFSEELRRLQAAFSGQPLDAKSLATLGTWLVHLAQDSVTPAELLKLNEIETDLTKKGLRPVWDDLRTRKPLAQFWPDVLRNAWLRSCLEEILLQDPTLPAFRGRLHEEIAEEFRRLDRERLALAVHRVQRAHAEAAVQARNQYPDQSKLVAREAEKRTRHLPLRRLFAEAPNVLLALRPCWMASPLSVSQLMPGHQPLFDLVVFDEASQVLPEDAVTSLLRGRQAVIAGDQRQLPPTTFFAAGPPVDLDGGDGGSDSGTEGFQSILDVMSAFLDPPWSLDWHYRSRDERLIAFSNHRIYGGRLVTFPGAGLLGAINHVLVPFVPGEGGQEGSASPEVRRVVELVLEHARTRPIESLGVITMGIEHANRIEMALSRERQALPELDEFFAQDKLERFFVKNLERVQGDERDAIILSIGYGKNDAGQLLYRFGPLLQDGGERRLNVAITRARRRMTVVSSFSHADMVPEYPKVGVRLLRGFLEYAASGGTRLDGVATVTDVPLNDFEQSVYDELTRQGMRVLGQVGTSRYRIDLAVMHPSKPGQFVLAVECDGASYHSAPTARDRDRLRQQQLEALGWRVHRIWSTDWFMRREEEVQRVLEAFRRAVREADEWKSTSASEPNPAVRIEPKPSSIVTSPRHRGPKPSVLPGKSIDEYPAEDLRRLVGWVLSDGRLPTDDEIIDELTRELGFQRRGNRIVARLSEAIHIVRKGSGYL